MSKVSAILAGAGEGVRFGKKKQYVHLNGVPVIEWCLEKLNSHESISEIVLVLNKGLSGEEYMRKYPKISAIVPGGERRQDSVYSGFQALNSGPEDLVLVHDAVRPLFQMALIDRIIEAVRLNGAVVPVVPVEDTLKEVRNNKVLVTLDRSKIFRVQTPQGFSYALLKDAFESARKDGVYGTDEASLVERLGKEVHVVPGDSRNIKITTPVDLSTAEALFDD